MTSSALSLGLKAGSALALATAVFLAVLGLVFDLDGPGRRCWARYVAFLDRKLRSLFLRTPGQHIAVGQIIALVALAVVVPEFRVPYWYAWVALVLAGPALELERRRKQRLSRIERQLDAFILALANAMKSIPSVSAAFQSVALTSSSPIREEIELCNREMRVGSSLDEALLHMAARVGSSRLDSALSAVVLGRQIGGNLPRVLETTASSIREMFRLEGVLRTKTSEAKTQLYVIGAAPLLLVGALSVMSPGYFQPLQESRLGTMVGVGAAGSWLAALILARKILSVNL